MNLYTSKVLEIVYVSLNCECFRRAVDGDKNAYSDCVSKGKISKI